MLIFAGGVGVGVVLLSMSALVGYGSFFGALLMNLAASALTVALTAVTVDALIARSEQAKLKAVSEIAQVMCERIDGSLLFASACMFGYTLPDGVDANNLTPAQRNDIDEFLQHNLMHKNKPDESFADGFMVVAQFTYDELDAMLRMCSVGLRSDTVNSATVLHELIRVLLAEYRMRPKTVTPKIIEGIPLFQERFAKLKALVARDVQ